MGTTTRADIALIALKANTASLALTASYFSGSISNATSASYAVTAGLAQRIEVTDLSGAGGQYEILFVDSSGSQIAYAELGNFYYIPINDTLFVDNVILLGGAIGRKDKEGWERAANAVSGKIYNCFSKQDKILDVFYRTANAGLSDPIGVRPIDCGGEKIVNIDCSSFVESHMTWKEHYAHIHRLIFGSKD